MRFFIYLMISVLVMSLSSVHGYAEDEPRGLIKVFDNNVQLNCDGEDFEVPCYVVAPDGKKLGPDEINDERYYEIEGSWASSPPLCLECIDSSPDGYESLFNLIDGEYSIRLTGKGLTPYYISISIDSGTLDEGRSIDIYGVTDIGRISEYKFNFSTESSDLWGATRVATPGSLIEDIKLSRKVNWIDNDGIMTSLLRTAEAAVASIERGQAKTAKNQLNALIREVKAQDEKHIHKHAVTMLIEDAEYIISGL